MMSMIMAVTTTIGTIAWFVVYGQTSRLPVLAVAIAMLFLCATFWVDAFTPPATCAKGHHWKLLPTMTSGYDYQCTRCGKRI